MPLARTLSDDQRALVLRWLGLVEAQMSLVSLLETWLHFRMPSTVQRAQDTMFARLDSNHDGRVTHAELVAAVAPSVAGWPEAALLPDAIMRFGDGTGRGWICLHEFQALVIDAQSSRAAARQAACR